jgi:hypothetical protein
LFSLPLRMSQAPTSTTQPSDDVDSILAIQRDESDARNLINEVEKINLFEGIHRFRWIWELFQNARDEAGNGIEIVCEVSRDKFRFLHNGEPFNSGNLLALTRKTSTKPNEAIHGKAGKFGTGFVTTHILNKRVAITGVHKNRHGKRRFELILDRSSESLDQMKECIAGGINDVRRIDAIPAASGTIDPWNCFTYDLSEVTLPIALGGINQLKTNLDVALLLNENVRSVKIIVFDELTEFKPFDDPNVLKGVSFFRFDSESKKEPIGVLYKKINLLTLAVPAMRLNNRFVLLPFGERARLFKELPLIGTEDVALPCIVNHSDFQPTELRDGVRTRLASDTTEVTDAKAKRNRDALREFAKEFSSFLASLAEAGISNLHQLAESGLPYNDGYYDRSWYETEFQKKLRTAILERPLVKTVSGSMSLIKDALFLNAETKEIDQLYALLNTFFPNRFPDEESFSDWVRIINQDVTAWPANIIYDVNKLVETASKKDALFTAFPDSKARVEWLQLLVSYLEACNQERLGVEHAIYPTNSGELAIQTRVFHDPGLYRQFKKVSAGMGRPLDRELLPGGFQAKFVSNFNVEDFFNGLNKSIGLLPISKASPQQIQAVFDLCCAFKTDRAEKREQWFDLIHQLRPDLASEKVPVEFDQEYNWESSEKWSLNYICTLVQASETLEIFKNEYFHGDEDEAIKWINGLIDYVFRNKENREAGLEYKLIPTQDGKFKVNGDRIHIESNPSEFADRIKPLYRDYVGAGDPADFLVHPKLKNENLRSAGVDLISRPVDDLFNSHESEEWVREGQKYHALFLALRELMEEESAAGYFPGFSKKQPILYIKAFGEGSSLGKLLKLKKSVEEFEQLDKLKLTVSEMQQLDEAVAGIGSAEPLIEKAKEMVEVAEQVRWRKDVGDAAELAFVDALAGVSPEFPKPENPDDGKDFVIRIKEKFFSIEIKSAIENRESVKMSLKQGRTASIEKDKYALCVISRPYGKMTTKDEFIGKAKFVVNIGQLIGDKIVRWELGVSTLEADDNVSIQLDYKTGFVNVRKPIWNDGGISFSDFITHLRKHFEIENR